MLIIEGKHGRLCCRATFLQTASDVSRCLNVSAWSTTTLSNSITAHDTRTFTATHIDRFRCHSAHFPVVVFWVAHFSCNVATFYASDRIWLHQKHLELYRHFCQLRNIIRTALCWIVWHNVYSPQHTYMSISYRFNRLGLSHWNPYAVHRGGCLELYYCNTVEWFLWDSSLILPINWFPSVIWHCWFGHPACKNHPRNDLLCVEWDVKPYTLTHLMSGPISMLQRMRSSEWKRHRNVVYAQLDRYIWMSYCLCVSECAARCWGCVSSN